jgi:hypothetical protein
MRRSQIATVVALCFAVTACANGTIISFKPFGLGQTRVTSAQNCGGQGYREGSAIYSECTAFYDKQTFTNRRNIVLAVGVAAWALFNFEEECECFFGPDRGTKYTN